MEAIGVGLKALGDALSNAVGWAGFVCIIGIAATTFLVYTKTISLDDVKNLFKKNRRY